MGDSIFDASGLVTIIGEGPTSYIPRTEYAKKEASSKPRSDSGSKIRSDSGSKPRSDSGSKPRSDSGSKTRSDSISKRRSDSGSKTRSDSRSKTRSPRDSLYSISKEQSIVDAKKATALGLIDEHREWGISEADLENDLEETLARLRVKKETSIEEVIRKLRRSQEIFLCFLMDTTGSMYGHVNAVREQIQDITDALKKKNLLQLNVGFIGYKDHCDGEDHFEVFDFTKDTTKFKYYVKSIVTGGGGDTAEDVIGGLQKTLELPWKKGYTNIIFHIADAPAHGTKYHDDILDDYPDGYSTDKSSEEIFKALNEKNIHYYFGKIKNDTDKMIEVFRLNCNNQIITFDIKDPINIEDSVVTATTQSVSIMKDKTMELTKTKLSEISLRYVKEEPRWKILPVQKGTLVNYVYPTSIVMLIDGTMKIKSRLGKFRVATAPFAHGSERAAYYAHEYHKRREDESSESVDLALHETDQMVLKKFLRSSRTGKKAEGSRYLKAMEAQTIASFLADQFNSLLIGKNKVKFLKTKVLRLGISEPFEFYSVEKRYKNYDKEEFIKISNNAGYVTKKDISEEYVLYCLAFSHWTYEITNKFLMVVDLQGQKISDNMVLLTDPAIHCIDCIRFNSGTNLGEKGFEQFFETHECNKFCKELGIEPVFADFVKL